MELTKPLGCCLFSNARDVLKLKGHFKQHKITENTTRWYLAKGKYIVIVYTQLGVLQLFQFQCGLDFMFTFTQIADSLGSVIGTDNQGTAYDGIYSFNEIKNLLFSIEDFLYNTMEHER